MSYRWIDVKAFYFMEFIFQSLNWLAKNFLNYLGASILFVSMALLKTILAPPKSMVPFTATSIKAPNIDTDCTTSVQTTAFKPPYIHANSLRKKNHLPIKSNALYSTNSYERLKII